MRRPRSLKRPLILYPLLVNFAILLVSFSVLLAVAIRVDSGGPYADERMVPVVAQAIIRQADGQLLLRTTPEFAELRKAAPDLWFVAEDDHGQTLSFGAVPAPYISLPGSLRRFSYGQLRDRDAPHSLTAVIRRHAGPAGALTIIGRGRLSELRGLVLLTSNIVLAPIFLLLGLTSLLVTPWIVNRSLAGVSRISQDAGQIDAAHRGRRLNEELAPAEIAPLVRAMNAALLRLDEGYERQRRFIAAAAHEMRTPIAILRARVETAGRTPARDLAVDVQRLATLAEQLLDLQRLDQQAVLGDFDLSGLVRQVVADLAPLLIASGRTIEVRAVGKAPVHGDEDAFERVVTNLVQNAIEHGGAHIVVRVSGNVFEVEDNGPGIPPEERERMLEPFQRLYPRGSGSGLGLSLVQQVVERHGGRLSILGAPGQGTIVRIALPPQPDRPRA